jgi:hypothetical protein
MGSAYFHEDDYCQVELLPVAAREHCLAEMGHIKEFAEAHRDGAGFTEMYIRGEPPLPLASLGITLQIWRSAVETLLSRFAHVFTGYSSYREPCESVVGWGFDDGDAIFAHVGEDGVVGPVWLSLYGTEQVEQWCKVLRCLPRSAELVIADWNGGLVVMLDDESQLADYLRGEPDA